MSLHNEIMNLGTGQTLSQFVTKHEMYAYKCGHRDARHAAAELAFQYEAEIERLTNLLERAMK